jgi:hypothetical protein
MDTMEHVKRQNPPSFRVGPIEWGSEQHKRIIYLVRGEKGSVTYHDNGAGEHADINIHSLTREPNSQDCMWNGNIPTYCDGRLCNRIEGDVERIWLTLESEYWCL